ncbi:MAG: hypothetical protein ACTHYK_08930, partial [Brevibacterium aurantiacum]|uniref:hypothetical protein n=1 Tax=Brevibacterium aurantiacum TaxID=273384 RepID=UPI003F8E4422
ETHELSPVECRDQIVIVDTLCKTDLTGQSERKCLSMMRKEFSIVRAGSVSLRMFKAHGR